MTIHRAQLTLESDTLTKEQLVDLLTKAAIEMQDEDCNIYVTEDEE